MSQNSRRSRSKCATFSINYCSENIERYRKIIEQRIVAVREEANRKYSNLVESIPLRLEKILKLPEPKSEEVDEEKSEDGPSQQTVTVESQSQPGSRKNSNKSVTD